jgi:uncharacterized repeat protein (TIGR02543 family)
MNTRKPFLFMVVAVILGMVISCEDQDLSNSSTEHNGTTDQNSTTYTVSFQANGGSPAPQQQNIDRGGKVIKPQEMSKKDYIFEGWYKEAAFNNLWNFNSDTVTRNMTLYARWVQPVIAQGTTLAQKLQWLNSSAANNTSYLLEVSDDEFLNSHTLSYSEKSNISIHLVGTGGVKTIELYGSGPLFTIGDNVTLSLNENIVLKGSVTATGGNLIMNNGSKITRVSVSNNGTFTMNGGEISDNTASSGGGVYISNGTFTMNGGKISDNNTGEVYISNGTFTMNGGKISDNNTGGGDISNGTFTMNGGKISGNTSSYGGGVYVIGTFTMTGGEISGNTASSFYNSNSYGGGVYVANNSSFEKTGGIITGYSSDTINGNVVKNYDGNILDNRGHAVYVEHNNNRFIRRKETTAGPQDNLIYIRNEPAPPTISGVWDDPVPNAPGTPVVTTQSSGSLTVQWTTVEWALSYEVWIGTTNDSASAIKQGADISGTSVTLTGLTNGTTYYVWLKAKNNTGTSGFSPSANGKPTGGVLYKGAISDSNKIGSRDLSQSLTYISANAVSGDNYFIVVGEDEDVSPMNLSYSGKTVGITLLGDGEEKTITLASSGSMFTINSGVTLTLDENISLVGMRNNNNTSLILVNSNGTLTMNDGTISGNSNYNSSNYGGGVYVGSGTFTMNGGKISGNTSNYGGGGVYVGGGTFTMTGGEISGNSSNYGGGVYVGDGTVTMNGGTISGNNANSIGGGIYITGGIFKKLPSNSGQNSGIIYGFEETGVDADGVPLKNTAGNSDGHAVHSSSMKRNTTAGKTDQIDSTTGRGLSASGEPPFGN